MVGVRELRKRIKKEEEEYCPIKTLPTDIIVEVVARVGSVSFTDLVNAKLSCRDFLEASDHARVLELVCIDKLPAIPWWVDEVSSFLNRCKESGNAEAIYRQGMVEYFSSNYSNRDSGLRWLKMATEKAHREATYVYGVILFVYSGGSDGMSILSCLIFPAKSEVGECRKKVKSLMREMWVNKYVVDQLDALFRRNDAACGCSGKGRTAMRSIPSTGTTGTTSNLKEGDDGFSEYCFWNYQVGLFLRMLRS